NVGCAILRQEAFSEEELARLSAEIDPHEDAPLASVYYPLTLPGERFPENDPNKQPVLEPKPLRGGGIGGIDRRAYLQGILGSIALVERRGYDALEELGATPVRQVLTAGGGARNDMWTAMRGRVLGRETSRASNTDAAFGCALLGLKYAQRDTQT
ncbi:hypothetical protein B484DRAFT_332645, partial [Ochromonadaceae sp. CCMP2298]